MNHPIGPISPASGNPCRQRRPSRAGFGWIFAIVLASLSCLAAPLTVARNASAPLEHLGFPIP